jgi:hypothetical protein
MTLSVAAIPLFAMMQSADCDPCDIVVGGGSAFRGLWLTRGRLGMVFEPANRQPPGDFRIAVQIAAMSIAAGVGPHRRKISPIRITA